MLDERTSLARLRRLAATVGERRGWDFSRMRVERDPTPWEYSHVVQRYLRPSAVVLDVGTGGGEKLLPLALSFGRGVGIDADPTMIQAAEENRQRTHETYHSEYSWRGSGPADRVSFLVMNAEALGFPEGAFDLVLNRHCTIFPGEVVRVLRPGGTFLTQQVGKRNTQNLLAAFGWGPDSFGDDWWQDLPALAEEFRQRGCRIVARGEYDVGYRFLDLESLLFWLKAAPLPEEFDLEKHWRAVERIVTEFRTPRGIETNEHRELLIVKKP
jgi:SAM-dependent methyltransferase